MNMLLAAAVLGAVLAHPTHAKKGWYYNLTPREGGQACLVGPWNTQAACRDNLGSAQRSHPFACHLTGPVGNNCRNLGNGYGYTKSMPNPPTWVTTDNDCELVSTIRTHEHNHWVRFWFSDTGECTVIIKGRGPQTPSTLGSFTNYSNTPCPGWPWIYIGDSGGPGGDGVCN